jgi:NADH dehydrogenase
MGSGVFVTGGTGFIGRRLLARIAGGGRGPVHCLTRRPDAFPGAGRDLHVVPGDLQDGDAYGPVLAGCGTVVHLAAATGQAPPAEHLRVNAVGTRVLLDRCRKAGVERFVHVSSVAATFPNLRRYPYGRSKALAERAVVESGLPFVVLRPTIVVGKEGALWQRLTRLARQRLMPLPGGGRAVIQPVFVDDVVECVLAAADGLVPPGTVYAVGGPERLTFADFLAAIHRRLHGRSPVILHVPVGPLVALLSLVERPLAPLLPVSAGQLSAFRFGATTGDDRVFPLGRGRLTSIADMLALALEG